MRAQVGRIRFGSETIRTVSVGTRWLSTQLEREMQLVAKMLF